MLRTPTFQTAMRRHVLPIFFALCLPFFAKADLGVTFQMNQNGSQVTADVLVYNFTDILSMQFTIQWDPNELQFVSVGDFNLPELAMSDFGIPPNTIGGDDVLTFSWIDPDGNDGISVPDCSSIFRITFNTVNGQIPPLTFVSFPTPTEIVNNNIEFLDITQNLGCTNLGRVYGSLFRDDNNNCTNDGGDLNLEGWQVKLVVNKLPYYATTDSNGNFDIECPSGYCEASVLFPADGHLWEVCEAASWFQLTEGQEVALDFAAHDLGPIENPSGVFDLDKNGVLVKILPNPVQSGSPISIEATTETARQLSLQIFDTSGRLLDNWEQETAAGTSQFTAPTSLPAGFYLLKVADENGVGKAVRLVVY